MVEYGIQNTGDNSDFTYLLNNLEDVYYESTIYLGEGHVGWSFNK